MLAGEAALHRGPLGQAIGAPRQGSFAAGFHDPDAFGIETVNRLQIIALAPRQDAAIDVVQYRGSDLMVEKYNVTMWNWL